MNIYISVINSELKYYYYYPHAYGRETKVYRCSLTLTKPAGTQVDLTPKPNLLSDMLCCLPTIAINTGDLSTVSLL